MPLNCSFFNVCVGSLKLQELGRKFAYLWLGRGHILASKYYLSFKYWSHVDLWKKMKSWNIYMIWVICFLCTLKQIQFQLWCLQPFKRSIYFYVSAESSVCLVAGPLNQFSLQLRVGKPLSTPFNMWPRITASADSTVACVQTLEPQMACVTTKSLWKSIYCC